MADQPTKFQWTERRISRFATMLVSGSVAVADLVLLIGFARVAPGLPGGWRAHWYVPAGILLVFGFALGRFLKYLALFREDQ